MRKFGGLAGATSQPPTMRRMERAFSLLGPRVPAWVHTCADYYAAAALYEQLYRRSDAELRRLGLSREHLGQELCAACDRAAHAGSFTRTKDGVLVLPHMPAAFNLAYWIVRSRTRLRTWCRTPRSGPRWHFPSSAAPRPSRGCCLCATHPPGRRGSARTQGT